MKEKVIIMLIIGMAAICPFSLWVNFVLVDGIDLMQYHIDYRDSVIDTLRDSYYNLMDTVDSLKLELFKERYKPH